MFIKGDFYFRFIAVLFPLKAATLCTSRRAVFFSVTTFAVLLVYHSHILLTYQLLPFNKNTTDNHTRYYCYANTTLYPFYQNSWDYYLHLTTYSLLPFLIVLVLNVMIVLRLQSGGKKRKSSELLPTGGSPGLRRFNSSNGKMSKLTRVLFLVSFTWLILTAPSTITNIIISILPSDYMSSSSKGRARTISFILLWFNHAINFYLYCLSGKKLRGLIYDEIHCVHKAGGNRGSMRNSTLRTINITTSLRLHSIRHNTE